MDAARLLAYFCFACAPPVCFVVIKVTRVETENGTRVARRWKLGADSAALNRKKNCRGDKTTYYCWTATLSSPIIGGSTDSRLRELFDSQVVRYVDLQAL